MRLHQIKKLLHSKGNNYQSEETAYRMGSIASCSTKRGLISRIYKAKLKKLNTKTSNLINKSPNELNRCFSKEEVQMVKKHIKNVQHI
jgi:hypothetical protein